MNFEYDETLPLDLHNFDTSRVTDMSEMFDECWDLATIYVGNNWSTCRVTEGDGMFSGCRSLVGGAGTVYSSDYDDVSYAHVDTLTNPGYLTLKA